MICCICLEHNCNVITSCNHNFCLDCIDNIRTTNNLKTCPLCRNFLQINHIGISTRNQKNIVSEINFNSSMFNFINKFNNSNNLQEKINEMCIMLDFILNNKQFLLKRKFFLNTLYDKINEFIINHNTASYKLNKYVLILKDLIY